MKLPNTWVHRVPVCAHAGQKVGAEVPEELAADDDVCYYIGKTPSLGRSAGSRKEVRSAKLIRPWPAFLDRPWPAFLDLIDLRQRTEVGLR